MTTSSRKTGPTENETRQATDLPLTPCPSWCEGSAGHRQAVEDGCPVDDLEHVSADLGLFTYTLSSPYLPGQALRAHAGSVHARLEQPAHKAARGPALITVEVEVPARSSSGGLEWVKLGLTAGEARSLAAMLGRLADQDELSALGG